MARPHLAPLIDLTDGSDDVVMTGFASIIDCFCGAGGTSRGAVDAGLRVEWGLPPVLQHRNLESCRGLLMCIPAQILLTSRLKIESIVLYIYQSALWKGFALSKTHNICHGCVNP